MNYDGLAGDPKVVISYHYWYTSLRLCNARIGIFHFGSSPGISSFSHVVLDHCMSFFSFGTTISSKRTSAMLLPDVQLNLIPDSD